MRDIRASSEDSFKTLNALIHSGPSKSLLGSLARKLGASFRIPRHHRRRPRQTFPILWPTIAVGQNGAGLSRLFCESQPGAGCLLKIFARSLAGSVVHLAPVRDDRTPGTSSFLEVDCSDLGMALGGDASQRCSFRALVYVAPGRANDDLDVLSTALRAMNGPCPRSESAQGELRRRV